MATTPGHIREFAASTTSPLQRSVGLGFLKRCCDVVGSVLLIVLLSPLLLVVVFLVLVNDGFPVLHRRRVLGTDGEFDAFKFRTMRPDADHILANDMGLKRAYSQNFKLKCDPRITKLGRWLRKYSLDELPQLFNVLRGQMSLVGPRMITAPELEKYGDYKQLLLAVKPGLTGYWQVHGRQDVSYQERVRMDVRYITHWTFMTDLHLLCLTPMRVIHGKGAY
jgi:lipopolysaccharide/colanic/teichoic acid biosynthesis glycosyltransferase